MRRINGCKKGEVMRKERKLYNEDLHRFYSSPNIFKAIKHRKIR
jgi:hypothetical protein